MSAKTIMTVSPADSTQQPQTAFTGGAGLNTIRTVSIVGAGVMGRAIAAANVRAGFRVRISDADPQAAASAAHELTRLRSSVHGPHFVRAASSPVVSVATSVAEITEADLILEAIPENLAAKRAVLSSLKPLLPPQTIVASNTSSIPLSVLMSALDAPERLCGLHFCHPVEERSLVEVIVAPCTSQETAQRANAYAAALGKSPLIVGDGPGFVLNRILSPYLTEALELLLEGVDAESIGQAARDFGMPYGPFRQLDEFGVDVSFGVGKTLLQAFPDRFIPSELLIAMYKAGRLGRKAGAGFCERPDDLDCDRIDPVVRAIIAERSRTARPLTIEGVRRRLLLPMLLEATRVLDEALVENAVAIDAILRGGLGMTSNDRGLFGWAESIGARTLIEWLKPFQSLGKRFEPTLRLQAAAAERTPIAA